ncbi:NADH:flavin oxidoreductase [Propionibacteriaceae bacterium Y1923]
MWSEPLTINQVTLPNRLIRSSIGGRMAYYDGTVNGAWSNFEKRFAEGGVGAIISATLTIDERRWSPLEYPKISHDRYIGALRRGVRKVQALGAKYLMQLGDPGYHTQTSLFSQRTDAASASSGFDLLFGYRNWRHPLSTGEIEQVVANFAQAAVRVREIGCDGVEVTASKGYLIHQFLNPGINRRTDRYGGSHGARFQLLAEIVTAIREAVGPDFLFGVRLSARDYNHVPLNLRLPPTLPLRHWWFGNGIEQTIDYGKRLGELGVDFLHISNGFGFINPRENPGDLPVEEVRMFMDSTAHLTGKAAVRAAVLRLPKAVVRPLMNLGWGDKGTLNLDDARRFRQEVGLPVIANGGFQRRSDIERALSSGACDVVSMARPLLANPDLPKLFEQGVEAPARPCTFCNRCTIRTTTFPLGCYDRSRFDSDEQMEAQIISWSATLDPITDEPVTSPGAHS